MQDKGRAKNAGFTLVEVLVVVAILGIVSSLLIPSYLHYLNRARAAKIIGDWHVVQNLASDYLIATDSYPRDVNRYIRPPGLEDPRLRWHLRDNGDYGYDWNNWDRKTGMIGLSVYSTNRLLVWHLDRQYTGARWVGKRGKMYHFMFRLK